MMQSRASDSSALVALQSSHDRLCLHASTRPLAFSDDCSPSFELDENNRLISDGLRTLYLRRNLIRCHIHFCSLLPHRDGSRMGG